tara:strand:+ start:1255 stop:2151 length:897 start_codon:yes stop_codon:yes gene_type:complete
MKLFYFRIFPLFLFCCGIFAKTNFPGLDIYTSVKKLSLGGAGFLQIAPLSYATNPASYDGKVFSVSLLRYPASITSQSAGIIIPAMDGVFNINIGSTSYGTFQGYDENANSTNTYSSNDTWIKTAYAKGLFDFPVDYGLSALYLSSNYNNNIFGILTFTGGLQINLDSYNAKLGVSLHQFGIQLGDVSADIKPEIILSFMKKLTHLPLNLFLDITGNMQSVHNLYLGGIFSLSNKLKLKIGSSNKKIEHNINKELYKSIMGSTGIGFSYLLKNLSVEYGVFIYGTGSLVQGIEIGSKF